MLIDLSAALFTVDARSSHVNLMSFAELRAKEIVQTFPNVNVGILNYAIKSYGASKPAMGQL